MSGWLLLGIGAAVTLADLAVGLMMLRQSGDARGMELATPPQARAGRMILFLSPLVFILFVALAFGAIPVDGIEPIALASESRP